MCCNHNPQKKKKTTKTCLTCLQLDVMQSLKKTTLKRKNHTKRNKTMKRAIEYNITAKPLQESSRSSAEDLGAILALSALMNSQDVHYDQRQKGEENYRIKLDGFFIGVPQQDSTALLLLTDDMFETLAFGKNKPTEITPAVTSSNSAANDLSSSKDNHNLSVSAADVNNDNNRLQPMLVEIPASRKYLEARHSIDSVSRSKSYLSHFLNLLKKVRKH